MYIEDLRATPRDDIMTAMATAKFPDGSTPEISDVALLAANLLAGESDPTGRRSGTTTGRREVP
jgi:cytochrome P450 family 150 subfamily A5